MIDFLCSMYFALEFYQMEIIFNLFGDRILL
jgi:hypothetical protein